VPLEYVDQVDTLGLGVLEADGGKDSGRGSSALSCLAPQEELACVLYESKWPGLVHGVSGVRPSSHRGVHMYTMCNKSQRLNPQLWRMLEGHCHNEAVAVGVTGTV
jgi:hypothetical protein